jgi:AraC-like DNA-binding protein
MRQTDTFEAKRFRDDLGREVPPHAHDRGQFTCVISGAISQETPTRLWVVPRQRLVWTPPGVTHSARAAGPVEGWLVLVPPRFAARLPSQVCVLKTSALVLAILERLTELDDTNDATAKLLSRVILLELDRAEAVGLEIPLPRSRRLRAIADRLIDDPSEARSLDDWAREAALSRRSFTRHFEAETGLSFSQWHRRVVARQAIDLLSAGESVSSVALTLGYESVSAFIAMFKRLYGAPPARFVAGGD